MTGSDSNSNGDLLLYQLDAALAQRGGLHVLQALLGDDELEEIMFNGSAHPLMVYHRQHGMCRVNASIDERFARKFAQQVAAENNRTLDEENPILDAALPDGSRINVTIPPVSHQGVSFTIRKFRRSQITLSHMVASGGLSSTAAGFLWTCIHGFDRKPANLLVVGGTGSGKTTTLGALALLMPAQHRLVLIEDTPELPMTHANAVRLVTQNGTGMEDLMRSALRMRPDRIVVGEVRGPEARTLFEAMNTGHDGCAGTLHANSARESINRVTSPPMAVPLSQIVGLDLIVVLERRVVKGRPRRVVSEISEISGYGTNVARMNCLYEYDPKREKLVSTGIPSRIQSRICRAAAISAERFHHAVSARAKLVKRLARQDVDAAGFIEAVQSYVV